MRGAKRKGTRYFGPYAHAWAIRETLDQLLRVFPSARAAPVSSSGRPGGRPCLLGYIDKCSAPCVGRVTEAGHREIAEDFCDFMAGNTTRFVRLTEQMRAPPPTWTSSAPLGCGTTSWHDQGAGALGRGVGRRDRRRRLRHRRRRARAAVQVFHVRGGRVRGQRGWVAEKDARRPSRPRWSTSCCRSTATSPPTASPARSSSPSCPRSRGRDVASCSPPPRGEGRSARPAAGRQATLMETVRRNAEQSLARHKVARAGDLTARAQALEELQQALDPRSRRRCGSNASTSATSKAPMSSPRWSSSRTDWPASPSTAGSSSAEDSEQPWTTRPQCAKSSPGAFGAISPSGTETEDGRAKKFAYPPNLLVVDGGLPQVDVAAGGSCASWASSTSLWSGSPSDWKRYGCPATISRSSSRAAARGSTCSSGSATKRTASPSPSTANVAARR
jgi:excinuclease ABC subunit C